MQAEPIPHGLRLTKARLSGSGWHVAASGALCRRSGSLTACGSPRLAPAVRDDTSWARGFCAGGGEPFCPKGHLTGGRENELVRYGFAEHNTLRSSSPEGWMAWIFEKRRIVLGT